MGNRKKASGVSVGAAVAGTTIFLLAGAVILSYTGFITVNGKHIYLPAQTSVEFGNADSISALVTQLTTLNNTLTNLKPYSETVAAETETPSPSSIDSPWPSPEPTPAPALDVMVVPFSDAKPIADNIKRVQPSDAVPGDVFVDKSADGGREAFLLLADGEEIPFGKSPVSFIESLIYRPDLAAFVKPNDMQPGDIYLYNGNAFVDLVDGISLDFLSTDASRFIETPDLGMVSDAIRMRAGSVSIDTPGLKDAQAVLRIRPDVAATPTPAIINAPSPLPTSIPILTDTPVPTRTPEPMHTPTSTPQPTDKPAPASTLKPTDSPVPTSIPRPTGKPSPTCTPKPVYTPAQTFTPTPIEVPVFPKLIPTDTPVLVNPHRHGGAQE